MQISGHDSHYVADYLIYNNQESLTPLKINKLVFFSHAWTLGTYKKPLINETVEAWRYGPVIPSIYHIFKIFQDEQVDKKKLFGIKQETDTTDRINIMNKIFDDKEKVTMNEIINYYGIKTGLELIDITHKENSPWHKHYDKNKSFVEIPNSTIQEYYSNYITA